MALDKHRLALILALSAASAAAFWAANKLAWQIRSDLAAHLPPPAILDRALNDFHHPWHISLARFDLLVGLVGILAVACAYLWYLTGQKNRREREEYGSAAWAKPADIRPFTTKKETEHLLFTATEKLSLDTHHTRRNLNASVFGAAGAGKSQFLVLPNLHQASTSYVVTDPKGELYRTSAQYLREHGYQVRTFNLIDFAQSHTYNPLAYFSPEQPEVDCVILTENIITNTSGKKPTGGNDFWEKAERALLNALVAFVYFTSLSNNEGEYHPGTLIDVVDLLAKMEASEQNEAQKSEVDYLFEAVYDLIDEYDAHPQAFPPATVHAIQGLRFALSQYRVYTQGAGETKKSVIISLGVRLAPLHMSAIRRLLSSDTIALDTIGQEKTALFMIIPDTHAAFSFLVSLMYEQMFEKTIYQADHTPTGHLPIPVQCFMDEFANIGKIPSFERKIAVMRSRGISAVIICQNYGQGKALYKDDWPTILGNCDSLLFLGGQEKETNEYISKLLGKETIDATDTSEQRGRNASTTRQNKRLGRELLTADELARLPNTECIYILRGVRPFRSKKLPFARFTT